MRQSLGRSHEARQLMGEVPDDVLSGERKAPLVPHKVALPSGFSGPVNVPPGTPVPETYPSGDKNDGG